MQFKDLQLTTLKRDPADGELPLEKINFFCNRRGRLAREKSEPTPLPAMNQVIPLLATLTFAILLLTPRSASAVDVFPCQPNINAAYNAVLDATLKLDSSPSFITPDTISKVRSRLAFAKICLENAKKNKGTHRPSAIALITNAQRELEAMSIDMSHHEQARQLVKMAFERVHKAGMAGAR